MPGHLLSQLLGRSSRLMPFNTFPLMQAAIQAAGHARMEIESQLSKVGRHAWCTSSGCWCHPAAAASSLSVEGVRSCSALDVADTLIIPIGCKPLLPTLPPPAAMFCSDAAGPSGDNGSAACSRRRRLAALRARIAGEEAGRCQLQLPPSRRGQVWVGGMGGQLSCPAGPCLPTAQQLCSMSVWNTTTPVHCVSPASEVQLCGNLLSIGCLHCPGLQSTARVLPPLCHRL